MKKAVAARLLAKLPGFRRLGSFHLGVCNQEVISGYALDAPPGGLYVWRFVLPAFDNIDFLHLSLGTRIAELASGEEAQGLEDERERLASLLLKDWKELSAIRDVGSLLAYMNQGQFAGEYSRWAMYLAHIRNGELKIAERLESEWRAEGWVPGVRSVANNMLILSQVKDRSGWRGVSELLTEWSAGTTSKFCGWLAGCQSGS